MRINRDPFSAEHDRLGLGRVEIFSNPATSKLQGQVLFGIGNSALNSSNPYAANKPGVQTRRYGGNLTGPITEKIAYFADFELRQIGDTSVINARILDSTLHPNDLHRSVTSPSQRIALSARLDDQWNAKNTLNARYSWFDSQQDNSGVGKISLLSNSNSSRIGEHVLQFSNTSVVSQRAVNELRLQYTEYVTTFAATDLTPTVSVLDSFVGGGSSLGPTRTHQNRFEIQNYASISTPAYVLRFGVRFRSSLLGDMSAQNFNGNFIFAGGLAPRLDANDQIVRNSLGQPDLITINSLERYRRTLFFSRQALSDSEIRQFGGGASQFLLSGGRRAVSLTEADIGLFAENSWRVRSNLILGLGLRYEAQNHLGDWTDFALRMSVAWALPGGPGNKQKVGLPLGSGLFYDRFNENLVLQTIRFNGINQQQILIKDSNFFPEVPALSTLISQQSIGTIREADANLRAPHVIESAAGIEFQLPGKSVASFTYRTARGIHLLRSRNTTAPLPPSQFSQSSRGTHATSR